MPTVPKPKPPKRRRCRCSICTCTDRRKLTQAVIGVVAASYTRGELLAVLRAGRASLLPPDGD